jgi:hypothetical protein
MTRGGARRGAGRPRLGEGPTIIRTVRLPQELIARVSAARLEDETFAAFVRSAIQLELMQRESTS